MEIIMTTPLRAQQLQTRLDIHNYDERTTLHYTRVYTKLDGVCCIYTGTHWMSRNREPLYNLPTPPVAGFYECFIGNWNDSVSAVRTREGIPIPLEALYRLDAHAIDPRLGIGMFGTLTPEYARRLRDAAIAGGAEGIIIYARGGKCYKYKRVLTHDVVVIGWQEGTGKYKGIMGALLTPMGKVGTGFTDAQRREFTRERMFGKCIEVSCMEITTDNMMRHARFVRLREDKQA